jgi:hypothetical protein
MEQPLGTNEPTGTRNDIEIGDHSGTGEGRSAGTEDITGQPSGDAGSGPSIKEPAGTTDQTWTERMEMAGSELVGRVQELIEKGNVRRVIVRYPDGRKMLEIPLTAGVSVGVALALLHPVLIAVATIAAMLTRFKVEVVREGSGPKDSGGPGQT